MNHYAKLPEDALWKTLKQGLRPNLRASLVSVRPQLHTYQQWKQLALELGAKLDSIYNEQQQRQRRPSKGQNGDNHDSNDTSQSQREHKNKHNDKLAKAIRDDRARRGACFDCGKEEHIATNCSVNNMNSNNNSSNDNKKQKSTEESRKKRRQGDPHYPASKRQETYSNHQERVTPRHQDSKREETGTVRITEIDSDRDINNTEDSESDSQAGKD